MIFPQLPQLKKNILTNKEAAEDDDDTLKRTQYDEAKETAESLKQVESILAPIVFTALSFS